MNCLIRIVFLCAVAGWSGTGAVTLQAQTSEASWAPLEPPPGPRDRPDKGTRRHRTLAIRDRRSAHAHERIDAERRLRIHRIASACGADSPSERGRIIRDH